MGKVTFSDEKIIFPKQIRYFLGIETFSNKNHIFEANNVLSWKSNIIERKNSYVRSKYLTLLETYFRQVINFIGNIIVSKEIIIFS